MDRGREPEIIFALQSSPEQLEGDLKKYPWANRQVNQKPIFCVAEERPQKGMQVYRNDPQHHENQQNQA